MGSTWRTPYGDFLKTLNVGIEFKTTQQGVKMSIHVKGNFHINANFKQY